ncbi:patatin-like phospholipase family protein [Olivibacter sp. CPCC 100613]|uniref:patatin-like phospholipase family protein n=1 Tax=Olivibacter sp. CPCC 100613 TaxID=3079931 RepID=UPI002FF4F964
MSPMFNTSGKDHDIPISVNETPFDHIALAFSGGGFRAASFSLGVLSYLNVLPTLSNRVLLDNVTFISSASGGSITNALYALHVAQGRSFKDFYKKLTEHLSGMALMNTVFEKLNNDKEWIDNPDKRRNIINAFALTYDDLLFQHALLSDLYPNENNKQLEEVCFNVTEFYRGLLYRQQVKMKVDTKSNEDDQFRFGNFNIQLEQAVAGRLKLADLLAASSCFPAGFEPVIFPDDFTYVDLPVGVSNQAISLNKRTLLDALSIAPQEVSLNELVKLFGQEKVEKVLAKLEKPFSVIKLKQAFSEEKLADNFKIGMMDGGITDNQALESMLDAQKRRIKKKTIFSPFDLMLINDVGSHYMDPYKLPKGNTPYKGMKAISINNLIGVLFIFLLFGILLISKIFSSFQFFGIPLNVVIGTTICVLSLSILLIFAVLRRFIEGNTERLGGLNLNKNFSPGIVTNLFEHFGSTPIVVIYNMIKERIASVLILNNDVFLKRIRYLLYSKTYDSGKHRFKIKTNHVYDLSFSNDYNRSRKKLDSLVPSRAQQVIAQIAFEMPTTLWFDTKSQQEETLAALITCGQFTTCYNLLEYIHRLKSTISKSGFTYYQQLQKSYKEKIDFIEKQLLEDWQQFQNDPFFLYNRLGTLFQLKQFKPCGMEDFPSFNKNFEGLR